jgi:hypothetical protein
MKYENQQYLAKMKAKAKMAKCGVAADMASLKVAWLASSAN